MRHIFDFLVVRQPKHFTRPPPSLTDHGGLNVYHFQGKYNQILERFLFKIKFWLPGRQVKLAKKKTERQPKDIHQTHITQGTVRERELPPALSGRSRHVTWLLPFHFHLNFFFLKFNGQRLVERTPRDHQLRSIQLKLNLKFL